MIVKNHTSYIQARELSNIIWKISRRWNKEILILFGYQLIRAVDSISANLAEGWNRFTKKDKINFYIIARGSAAESLDWAEKAFERNQITLDEYTRIKNLLEKIIKDINGLIKGTSLNLKK